MLNEHKKNMQIFKAFSDENRLAIIKMLKQGELCACEIHEKMPISQSTLSHHMKILCNSGVINARRDGKWTYYSINTEGSLNAANLLLELTSLEITKNNEQ